MYAKFGTEYFNVARGRCQLKWKENIKIDLIELKHKRTDCI